jgi:uncharacterized protein YndB with AHSA1/START domain
VTNKNNSASIEREIFIAAPSDVVFDFLVKPELLTRWLGLSSTSAPKPGDALSVGFPESRYVARGIYKEISPPHRVVFTWGWDGQTDFPPGVSTVEIELVPEKGGTLVRLRHTGLPETAPDPFSPKAHQERWRRYLSRLAAAASEHS